MCRDVLTGVGAPRGNQAGPSGQLGLRFATTDCGERELVVQGTPSQAVGIHGPHGGHKHPETLTSAALVH